MDTAIRTRATLRTYGGDCRPPAARGSVGMGAGRASRTRSGVQYEGSGGSAR
ncbi:hypothetical protein SSPO_088830 [Streptomyces antimycoticus]|uniref:Uncharacterized protein n=1 Tax=Streptomyces antimycoticus TaxID=68175 RepID=A0A499UVG0_9ACTN|nr:hypothetical protein SSPO_088830 [Streptomyces antimycoticus]